MRAGNRSYHERFHALDNLVFLPATTIASMIRERSVSAVEVCDLYLAQIGKHNPQLNAIVTLDATGARLRAHEADAAAASGVWWGPLHGVPVAIKDAIETAGLRTTAGHLPLADYVPTADAPVVARLRAAGAIVLGMTNTPELGGGGQTMNAIFGRTNNPWALDRTPGGSTGGGAAAVAAGMTPLAIGSDNGGSVRIPAHFCGICSIKPTQHRVPTTGHIPEVPGKPRGMRNFNTIGPLARTVADLDVALRVIAGPDGVQWEVPPVVLEPMTRRDVRSLRIAWIDGWPGVPVSADTRAVMAQLARDLEQAGATVEPFDGELFDHPGAVESANALFAAEMAPSWRTDPEAPVASIIDYIMLLEQRDRITQALESALLPFDALLLPVTSSPAFHHVPHEAPIPVDGVDVDYWIAVTGHTFPFNLTGNPVVVIPAGRSDEGLPIGVQIAGRRWHESQLLGVAQAIEDVTGGFQQPPGH